MNCISMINLPLPFSAVRAAVNVQHLPCNLGSFRQINLKTAVEHIPANKNQHKLDKKN
ncbi:MAG: hypothetical protein PHD43_22850 [Methylococcales bacterium]|nr:hypothetical protein [Methylococcales bacterium]